MTAREPSNGTIRKAAIAAILLGVVLCGVGFAMGGSTSVTWAGLIGAGIALVFNGLISVVLTFMWWR